MPNLNMLNLMGFGLGVGVMMVDRYVVHLPNILAVILYGTAAIMLMSGAVRKDR